MSHPRTALTRALVAIAAAYLTPGCRGTSVCPDGLDVVADRSPAGRELWCKSPDGVRARWTELTAPERKRQTCGFLHGRPEGQFLAWHPNGKTWVEGAYREGVKMGKWLQWDDAGARVAEGEYRLGEFVAGAPVGFVAKCEGLKP